MQSIWNAPDYLIWNGCTKLNTLYITEDMGGGEAIFPFLEKVDEYIYLDGVAGINALKFPMLKEVGSYIYISNMPSLNCFLAPKLSSMGESGYLYNGGTSLPCDLSGFNVNSLPEPLLATACCAGMPPGPPPAPLPPPSPSPSPSLPPPPPSPKLPSASSVVPIPCSDMTSAHISNTVEYLQYAGCEALQMIYVSGDFNGALEFPHLERVKGYIYVDNVPGVTAFKTPKLTDVQDYITSAGCPTSCAGLRPC